MFVSSSMVTLTLPTRGSYEVTVSNVNSTENVAEPMVTISYNPACYNCSTNPVSCKLKVGNSVHYPVEGAIKTLITKIV